MDNNPHRILMSTKGSLIKAQNLNSTESKNGFGFPLKHPRSVGATCQLGGRVATDALRPSHAHKRPMEQLSGGQKAGGGRDEAGGGGSLLIGHPFSCFCSFLCLFVFLFFWLGGEFFFFFFFFFCVCVCVCVFVRVSFSWGETKPFFSGGGGGGGTFQCFFVGVFVCVRWLWGGGGASQVFCSALFF